MYVAIPGAFVKGVPMLNGSDEIFSVSGELSIS